MEPTLIPIELEDGTLIHIQADTPTSTDNTVRQPVPNQRHTHNSVDPHYPAPANPVRKLTPADLKQSFSQLSRLVRGYTLYTLQAFKDLGTTSVSEINLEFGVSVSARSGVPYIATGTADCNVKISVTCEFPKDSQAG